MTSAVAVGFACACLVAWPTAASAYRPFDGTDAAVAELGHIEFEVQGFGFLQEGPVKSLAAPAAVINYGFIENWEAVLQGELESEISPSHRESLTGNGVFLKHVVREGALQDKAGPSVATEFGLVLPNVDAGPFFIKPSWTWIISDRFPWGTIHLNFTWNLMSDPRQDFFVSTIIEGPEKWTVRPVVEISSDTMINGPQIYSGLAGLIWKVRDDLSVDVAVRHAFISRSQEAHEANEVRLGVTFSFPVDKAQAAQPDVGKMLHPGH